MIMLETGDTGKAVSAESDGALYSAIIGSESYVLNVGKKFTAEIQSNNKIKINDGSALVNGRHVRIASGDSELITINNGSHGMNRKDIIVIRYQKEPTGIESVKFLVIQGEETSLEAKVPSYTKGNILTGSTVVDFPLYEVSLTGINITEIKKLFMVLGTNADLTNKITELIGKRDYTFAQTNPSTYPINSYQLCKVGKLVCFSVTSYKKAAGRIDSRVIGQIPVEIAPPITLVIPFATTGAVTDMTRNPGNRLIINTDGSVVISCNYDTGNYASWLCTWAIN